MIHFKMPCTDPQGKCYDVIVDYETGAISVDGDLTPEITLPLQAIRDRYGDGYLHVYIDVNPDDSLTVAVFPLEAPRKLTDGYKEYLVKRSNSRLIFEAEVMPNTLKWSDQGVYIITPKPCHGDDPYAPKVVTNEEKWNHLYPMHTPLRVRFIIFRGREVFSEERI